MIAMAHAPRTLKAPVGPLVVAVASQSVVAFLVRMLPTLAPVLIVEAAVAPSFIGYLAAIGTVGSILFYLTGTPLLRRLGSVRIMQLGMLVAAAGTALLALPVPIVLALGSLLIGFGYAPSTPAGSDVLQRFAPKRHRTLLVLDQAGRRAVRRHDRGRDPAAARRDRLALRDPGEHRAGARGHGGDPAAARAHRPRPQPDAGPLARHVPRAGKPADAAARAAHVAAHPAADPGLDLPRRRAGRDLRVPGHLHGRHRPRPDRGRRAVRDRAGDRHLRPHPVRRPRRPARQRERDAGSPPRCRPPITTAIYAYAAPDWPYWWLALLAGVSGSRSRAGTG